MNTLGGPNIEFISSSCVVVKYQFERLGGVGVLPARASAYLRSRVHPPNLLANPA